MCTRGRWFVAAMMCILWSGTACHNSGGSAVLRDGGKQDATSSASTNDVGTSASGGEDDVGGSSRDVSADVGARPETETASEVNTDIAVPPDAQARTDVSLDVLDSWSAACLAYAKALCRVRACHLYFIPMLFGSEQNCEARYGGVNCVAQMNSPGSRVTPSSLSTCAQALSTESCADADVQDPAECAWQGALADQASCTYDQQCQSGLCDLASGTWCGSCKEKIPLGGSCPISKHECQSGLVCADSVCNGTVTDAGTCSGGLQWVCTKPASEGDACMSVSQCNWGLVCVGGRCVGVKSKGAACASGIECNPEEGLTCLPNASGSGGSCQPRSWADAGESCNNFDGLQCLDNAICKGTNGLAASIGVCSAAVANGAPCGNGIACQYPALCIGGKCQAAVDVASSCP